MIVVSVAGLLAKPTIALAGITFSPAWLISALACLFYLGLDVRYGLAMVVFMALAVLGGAQLASLSTTMWLAASLGGFFVGWAIQFVGHFFEGKKPAFVDDLIGLAIGPLFIVAEAGFALGLRPEVQDEIEQKAGPTRVGQPVEGTALALNN